MPRARIREAVQSCMTQPPLPHLQVIFGEDPVETNPLDIWPNNERTRIWAYLHFENQGEGRIAMGSFNHPGPDRTDVGGIKLVRYTVAMGLSVRCNTALSDLTADNDTVVEDVLQRIRENPTLRTDTLESGILVSAESTHGALGEIALAVDSSYPWQREDQTFEIWSTVRWPVVETFHG